MLIHFPSSRCGVCVIAVALLATAAFPQLSHAKCRASDFDPTHIQDVAAESNGASENLSALLVDGPAARSSPANFAFILAAAKTVKNKGTLIAHFVILLYIYTDMITLADKRTVNDFIGIEGAFIYKDLQSEADSLTGVANGIPEYGADEIKEARNILRKMETLFACGASDT